MKLKHFPVAIAAIMLLSAQPAIAQSRTSPAVTEVMESHLARTRAEVERFREFARVCNRAMMEVSNGTLLRYAEIGEELINAQQGRVDQFNPLPDLGDISTADAKRYSDQFNGAAVYLPAAENCPGPDANNYLLQSVSDNSPRTTRLDQITSIAALALRAELGSIGAAVRCDAAFMASYENELERLLEEAQRYLDIGRSSSGGADTVEVSYAETHVESIRQALYAARARREECDRRLKTGGTFDPVQRPSRTGLRAPHVHELFGGGGFGSLELPPANYGFVREGPLPEPEGPAAYSRRRVPVLIFEAGALFQGIGNFTVRYVEGDASNRVDIPASTTGGARGYPHTDKAPSNSTGIGGNVPMSVGSDVRVRNYNFSYSYPFVNFGQGQGQGETASGPPAGNIFAGVAVNYGDRDHRGVVSITTPVVATQTIEQGINELQVGVFVGAKSVIPLGSGARFTVGGQVGGYFYDFDLKSLETNDQNFGPLADRAFTNALDDSENGIGYRAGAFAEIGVDLSPGIELFAGGRANFTSERAQVINPFSGDFVLDGGTTFLDSDNAFDWTVMAGIRVRLGNQ